VSIKNLKVYEKYDAYAPTLIKSARGV